MANDLDMGLDGPDAEYVVIKDGYYYRPGSAGYTKNIAEAGRYTLAEAVRESHPNGPDGPRDGIAYELAPDAAPDAMTGAPKFTSTYAIVDVMKGRKKLAKHLAKHGPLRVTIVAELIEPHGRDDGVSIEFNANVVSITPEISRA